MTAIGVVDNDLDEAGQRRRALRRRKRLLLIPARGGEVERDVPISEFIERVRSEVEAKETTPRVG